MADGQTDPQQQPAQPAPNAAQDFYRMMMTQSQEQQPPVAIPSMRQGPAPQPTDRPTNYGADIGGKRADLANFSNSVQNLLGKVSNKLNERKQRELETLYTQYFTAVKGSIQADQDRREAIAALKQNPQDPEALQKLQAAQQTINQNKGIVDSMFNGPKGEKNHKILAKGIGIDDKNAGTPERQAAKAAWQKSLGFGNTGAGILSQVTMYQQRPQMKPATGGQLLNAAMKDKQLQQQMTLAQMRQDYLRTRDKSKLKFGARLQGYKVTGYEDDGTPIMQAMTKEERATDPVLKAKDDWQESRTKLEAAKQDVLMDTKNPTYKLNAMKAAAEELSSKARYIAASAEMMKAVTEKQKTSNEPIYAYDPQAGQLKQSTRAEAEDKGWTNPVPIKEYNISKDRDARAMINDVQANVSRYRTAMNQMYSEPMNSKQKAALVALTPEKLGMDLGKLFKLNLPDVLQRVTDASAFSVLSKSQKEAVIGYYTSLAAVPASQKALTNAGRQNKEWLDLELRTIPTPLMDKETFDVGMDRFQGNIDQTSKKTPALVGMPDTKSIREQYEPPQREQIPSDVKGLLDKTAPQQAAPNFEELQKMIEDLPQ